MGARGMYHCIHIHVPMIEFVEDGRDGAWSPFHLLLFVFLSCLPPLPSFLIPPPSPLPPSSLLLSFLHPPTFPLSTFSLSFPPLLLLLLLPSLPLSLSSSSFQTGQVIGKVTGSVKTQLIAHDKEVHDIAFTRAGTGRDLFASVGSDGSVRMFDLRYSCMSTRAQHSH